MWEKYALAKSHPCLQNSQHALLSQTQSLQSSPSPQQTKLSQYYKKVDDGQVQMESWCLSEHQKRFDRLFAEWCSENSQNYNICEDKKLIEIIQYVS